MLIGGALTFGGTLPVAWRLGLLSIGTLMLGSCVGHKQAGDPQIGAVDAGSSTLTFPVHCNV